MRLCRLPTKELTEVDCEEFIRDIGEEAAVDE